MTVRKVIGSTNKRQMSAWPSTQRNAASTASRGDVVTTQECRSVGCPPDSYHPAGTTSQYRQLYTGSRKRCGNQISHRQDTSRRECSRPLNRTCEFTTRPVPNESPLIGTHWCGLAHEP